MQAMPLVALALLTLLAPSAWLGGDEEAAERRRQALVWNDKGVERKAAGQLREAIEAFERALALCPTEATIASNLGRTWNDEGVRLLEKESDVEAALAAFAQGEKLIPEDKTLRRNHALALDRRGRDKMKQRRFDEAAADFDRALALAPDEAQVAFSKCALFHAKEDFDAGERETEKYTQKFPKEVEGWRLLSEIRYKKGEVKAAVEALEKAAELAPARADVKARLEELRQEAAVEGNYSPANSRHFQFQMPPNRRDQQALADLVAGILEDAYYRVGGELDFYPEGRTQVVFYEPKDFNAVTRADEWTGALFDGKIRVPIRDFSKQQDTLRNTLFHEYTHRVVSALAGTACPTWLNEGLAMMSEGRDVREAEARLKKAPRSVLDAQTLRGQWVGKLRSDQAQAAYDQALSMTSLLIEQRGRGPMATYLRSIGGVGAKAVPEAQAFEAAFRMTFAELLERWSMSMGFPKGE